MAFDTWGLRAIVGFCKIFVANIAGLTSPRMKLFSSVCRKMFSSIDKFVSMTIGSAFGVESTITGLILANSLTVFGAIGFGGVTGMCTSRTTAPLPHSSSAFASGMDAMGILLNVLYFQRDLGDARFVFLNGDTFDDCSMRRLVNDFGEALKSRIFIGCGFWAAAAAAAAARSRFNFSCSTADGLAVFFPAVVNSNRLKSFRDVFGTPRRSLQVVERVVSLTLLLILALSGGIDVLLPKLSMVPLLATLRSVLESPFNGVDVLKLGVSLAFALPRPGFIEGRLLRSV